MPSSHKRSEEVQDVISINEETMEWVFNKYFGKLVFYAEELLNNDEEKARDTVTNVFVYVWEQRARLEFKNEKLLQGYLYAITRNKVVDLVRLERKERTALADLKYLEKSINEEEEKDRALILTAAIAFIWEALDHLSPQQKAVVELLLAGKSHEQIAETLDMTRETVRINKFRAIAVFQKKFKDHAMLSVLLLLIEFRAVTPSLLPAHVVV